MSQYFKCPGIFWSARVPLAGYHNHGRGQHLGLRRDLPDLEHHQSGRPEDDGLHPQRERVWRACLQAGEAGVGDTGAVHASTSRKDREAGPAAAAA